MKRIFLILAIVLCLAGPIKAEVNQGHVMINEIAWMGTPTSANDEWIELFNNTNQTINLDGWVLKSLDGTPNINLQGNVPANSFYILERTDDASLTNIAADKIYNGAMGNDGEDLLLYNNVGKLVDRANFSSSWSFGSNETKQTIERVNGNTWQTSQHPNGTPKAKNSSGHIIGEKITKPEDKTLIKEEKPDNKITVQKASLHQTIDLSEELHSKSDSKNPWLLFLVTIAIIITGAIIFVLLKYKKS